MQILKNFVVFEGGDGTGATTQIGLLTTRFNHPGLPQVYITFEPTNGAIGAMIRSSLRGELTLLPETAAMLFSADRQEHLWSPGGVVERCNQGELVICDRYVLSSLVYQGIDCGEELPRLLNRSFPLPELLFFLDLDPAIAMQRIESRPIKERYEYQDYQEKVRERYHALLPEYQEAGVRVQRLDASKTPEAISEEIWKCIQELPIFDT